MKKSIFLMLALPALMITSTLKAQNHQVSLSSHLEPYGFIRSYAIFDSRNSSSGEEELFYFAPYDKAINLEGRDIYSNPSFKMNAISSRLGLNVNGFRYGNFNVSGKVEADFYLMNGTTASLRLRQAYTDLVWDGLGYMENSFSIRIGQAWHPMSADMPYCINVESGSPFNPYARSPQIMFNVRLAKHWDFTAGSIYPMQYLPTGPSGPSQNYVKYGLIPEIYAGVSFAGKYFLARAGVDFLSLKPRWRTTTYNYTGSQKWDIGSPAKDRISMLSPYVYLQYSKGRFSINAKSVLAQGGDHLSLMSGYAVYDLSDPYKYLYTPIQSTVSFLSLSYGKKLQFMVMAGYMKTLGTKADLPVTAKGYAVATDIYYFSSGYKNINQMMRFTPTIAYNFSGLTVAVEFNNTMVEYGNVSQLSSRAIPQTDLHYIMNNRVVGMVKFSF